jgi:chorismate mutase
MSRPDSALRVVHASDLTLEALRSEIDAHDDQILALLERRMAIAARVRAFKDEGRTLNLKPDREARVIARLLDAARPERRPLVEAVWREVLAAGLAAQGAIAVSVWPGRRGDLRQAARARFGAAATYREAASASDALAVAADGEGVAVLSVEGDQPWWADLSDDLWAFDVLNANGAPALAVGRIDPVSLAHGRVLRVSAGGDADPAAGRPKVLATAEGLRLQIEPDRGAAPERNRGVIGRLTG